MTVFKGSRYDGALVTEIKYDEGSVRKYVHDGKRLDETFIKENSRSYTWDPGDEFDYYADGVFNNVTLWWAIADVNNVLFPMEDDDLTGVNAVRVGMLVNTPNLDGLF